MFWNLYQLCIHRFLIAPIIILCESLKFCHSFQIELWLHSKASCCPLVKSEVILPIQNAKKSEVIFTGIPLMLAFLTLRIFLSSTESPAQFLMDISLLSMCFSGDYEIVMLHFSKWLFIYSLLFINLRSRDREASQSTGLLVPILAKARPRPGHNQELNLGFSHGCQVKTT